MTTPDLLRKVAEAVQSECVRTCTEIGERAQMRRLDLDAIIQRVLADHAEVLNAPDSPGWWWARLRDGDREWEAIKLEACDGMLIPNPENCELYDFDRWQRIVPAC